MARVVVVTLGNCGVWCMALLASSSCTIDRRPEFSDAHHAPAVGRLPNRTTLDNVRVDPGTGNSAGAGSILSPVPTLPDMPALVGGLRCGDGPECPFTPVPTQPCCTTARDVERGAAREVGACGVDFSATGGAFFADACWQREQVGNPDARCPGLTLQAGVEEPGCCSDNHTCGAINTGHQLGCHYQLDTPAMPCGTEDIVDDVQCEPLGVFGVRSIVDVSWGGRSGGLVGLTDDGRDKIVIHLKITIDAIENASDVTGTVQPCGVDLPAFYSTTLCESYKPLFPVEIWESTKLPQIALNGRYECLHPGCLLSIRAQTVLLGIELDNPEAPWPTAAQTPTLTCSSGRGADCFIDHDDDQLPGVLVKVKVGGNAPGAMCSNQPYAYRGAPLSANPLAIFDSVKRADRLFLGTRTKLGGSGKIADDCNSGVGSGIAEFVQSRGWGCFVQQGTANFGESPAGPEDPCLPAEASFMDENLPIYNILNVGEVPSEMLDVRDTSASVGPQFSLVRLGPVGAQVSCAQVRDAQYP